MKIVCFLLKLVLKILLLPVAFLLRFLCFIWNLLMQLSMWVLSPVMLFVLGCGIYSVVRASWTDVFLLTLIEMGLFLKDTIIMMKVGNFRLMCHIWLI